MKRVFISYAPEDLAFRDALIAHLHVLCTAGIIEKWHDGEIHPGEGWRSAIERELQAADIIVLLVSADFLASTACQELELGPALARWKANEARIVPVIVRACHWEASSIAQLEVLPSRGKPVATWTHQDDAWTEVTRRIRADATRASAVRAAPPAAAAREPRGDPGSPRVHAAPTLDMSAEQTHYALARLPWGEKSRGYWSIQPTGTVIVFVHGFGGGPVTTWSQFENLLPGAHHHDLVFFGYDGVRSRCGIPATQLREFLDELWSYPVRTTNSCLDAAAHRPAGFRFDRFILVGHSLGGVICRRALLDARNGASEWLERTTLALYAPAHMGAHVLALISNVMGVFKLPLAAVAEWAFPVISDLKEGSQFLKDLRDETKGAIERGNAEALRARLVVLAEHDTVVNTNTFSPHDAPATILPCGHLEVCRPTPEFTAPLDLLLRCL
jgi:pimeloyl-ACP methyl ester carboxylesterase